MRYERCSLKHPRIFMVAQLMLMSLQYKVIYPQCLGPDPSRINDISGVYVS
jgi:hypothetical protein